MRVLRYMLDENEFLSPHGVRSLSKFHSDHPYVLHVNGSEYRVDYEPAESRSGIFGGNSNWRGPVWFPVNFLLIESLQRFHYYFGDDFKWNTRPVRAIKMTLWQVAAQLSRSLSHIFLRDANGRRPVYGGIEKIPSRSALARSDPFLRIFSRQKPATAWAPRTRPAGPLWWPN